MSTRWLSDLVGTAAGYLRLGLSGVRLKDSSGNLLVRNAGDSADAEITASKVNASGPDIVLDSDGNALTVSQNSGQSAALQVILPAAKGTDGFHLAQKAGTSAGVIELEFVAAVSNGTLVDVTDLAFGSSATVTMFTLPANATIHKVEVIVDTAWDTAATLSVGVNGGSSSKYLASSQANLRAAAASVFEVNPGLASVGSSEDLEIAYSAASASAGAARVFVHYSTPA